MKKQPNVAILFDQNWREAYYPAHAYDALKGKADVAFFPVSEFDGAHLVNEIYRVGETKPDFIAVDIPNDADYAATHDILGYMAFADKRERLKLFFGVVKNDTLYGHNHYVEKYALFNSDYYPVVQWDRMKNLKKLGHYEIKHALDEPKVFSKDWWIDRKDTLIF